MGVKGPKFPHLTSKKLVDDGFMFKYSLEEMFEDAIECCKEKGYLWTMKLTRWLIVINKSHAVWHVPQPIYMDLFALNTQSHIHFPS